ncbi:DEAD/DEAH box helicase [Ruegeria sp. A3M17]|uniref:DEAD/DEAH box helicase n=1 Tax=Ruegeria sp. A3M17 TaxID=2267229 RepID=UPI000DE8B69F|nr:DEAD/DEAH box helicase [Ruegeria sp. A3M17]RBW57449.1 DEAD/DEAH box helicase [Ruegeria sp. A3M17]
MRPEATSRKVLGITQAKAKMYEYGLPVDKHISIPADPQKLFVLTIGLLGDVVSQIAGGEVDEVKLSELQINAAFSASYFDSFEGSKLNSSLDPYTRLLGATAFYLASLPGSAKVLSSRFEDDELFAEGVENLLSWLIEGNYDKDYGGGEGEFSPLLDTCHSSIQKFFIEGQGEEQAAFASDSLRNFAHDHGSPRQLLLADCVAAVVKRKLENSSWYSLPNYTDASRDSWAPMLSGSNSVPELWPAQHLLGKANVFRGDSAVIQMPTSSGKTKSVEIIIRSAFFERGNLAVIIAPFRALCHEIRDELAYAFSDSSADVIELSDALTTDFELNEFFGKKQIVVLTPEKLLYVLRLHPEIGPKIDLAVFDEGHQFDSGTRGITYELLLTTLRSLLPDTCQKVLISAVIKNAPEIGEWLNRNENVVSSTLLAPSSKAVGFVSWEDPLGRVVYVSNTDIDSEEFFVPWVLERKKLPEQKRDKKEHFFPEKEDPQSIAIDLGLKLFPNGGVAIFCGRKESVVKVCQKVANLIRRGALEQTPLSVSDTDEVEKLSNLVSKNIGEKCPTFNASQIGIFSHQGDTPQGIRLAVEHAMRSAKISFVVCTSTLAQGVNLPIRYLIVSGVRQGKDRIKVRDFQNLAGRAGRAGMHTEGTILFSDPKVFDGKNKFRTAWRWEETKQLFDPIQSEPCISNLTSIFHPLQSPDRRSEIAMDALDFAKAYIDDPEAVESWATKISDLHPDIKFERADLSNQIQWRASLISAIESFLVSNWPETEAARSQDFASELAKGTLAYHLADDETRAAILELFILLSDNVSVAIGQLPRVKHFGRTLYGLHDARAISSWLDAHLAELREKESLDELADLIWPLLADIIRNETAKKISKPDLLPHVMTMWINGHSYFEIWNYLTSLGAKLTWGSNFRNLTVQHIVNLCDGAFAFDGTLVIGAIIELVDQQQLDDMDDQNLIERLQLFLKALKYGLPNQTCVSLHEIGFTDRVVVRHLFDALGQLLIEDKQTLKSIFRSNPEGWMSSVTVFPSYFVEKMRGICQL